MDRTDTIVLVKRPNDPTVDIVGEAIIGWAIKKKIGIYDHVDDSVWYDDCKSLIFIALGGDGTMLGAARLARRHQDAKVIGFNFGHLGFLTEELNDRVASGDMFHFIDRVISSHGEGHELELDKRMSLNVMVHHSTSSKGNSALNEVVLSAGDGMVETTIYVNNKRVAKYNGSGTIISTSTGSTAQALSAGGAIISPNTNVLQIVPMLPHSLTMRPIITTGRDQVDLVSSIKKAQPLRVLTDGIVLQTYNDGCVMQEGDVRVTITRGADITMVHPHTWDFWTVLSQKMGWCHTNGNS